MGGGAVRFSKGSMTTKRLKSNSYGKTFVLPGLYFIKSHYFVEYRFCKMLGNMHPGGVSFRAASGGRQV